MTSSLLESSGPGPLKSEGCKRPGKTKAATLRLTLRECSRETESSSEMRRLRGATLSVSVFLVNRRSLVLLSLRLPEKAACP